MKIRNATAIALLLIITISATLVILPAAQAQAPKQKTYAVIDAIPNPVGVGEDVLLRFGILQPLGKEDESWKDITITVVDPDGITKTLGPFKTDSTGSSFTIFTPDKAGTYKLTTNFPEQTAPSTFFDMERGTVILAGTVMQASTSETISLVVLESPLPTYPGSPLPAEYWSRPVDPQLREWYTVTGNWMTRPDNALALYNDDAPETAHVLWAKQLTTGGLAGGLWGPGEVPVSSETGDAYAGKFIDSVILNGILYYNRDDAKVGSNGICAVDLRTGKELWFRNNTVLSFGQVFYFNSFNYDGVFTYLWDTSAGSTWKAYDPFNGEWIYTMTNVPMTGTRVFGPSGEILIYQIDYVNRWMALWNSTAAGQTAPGFSIELAASGSWGAYYYGRLVHGSTIDASDPRCYSWNVTIPAGLTAGSSFFTPILKVYPDRVVSIDFNQTRVRVWALNTKGLTKTSTSTTTLFDKTWNAPSEWLQGSNTLHYVGATNEVKDGVIAVWSKELRKHYGFSVEDGRYLFETDSEHWLDAYGWGNVEHTWYFAYGKLYSVGVAGIVYAYDAKTGDTVWTYNLTDAYNEPVTGNNWWGWISIIADGKIYVGHLEHSAEMPMPRGAPFICLNATTGEEIWRVNGMFRQTRWGGNAVIGDSIIATMDTYDQRIYAIGKGPSETRVSVSPAVLPFKNSVMITGYVTDISAGTKDDTIAARFPNGVPAVSDESMSDWMLYVYKQFPRPANATGVKVTLSVVDANNNCREIGTVTSDANGFFHYTWTPDIPGDYVVYATFAGSKAYWPSQAVTAFNVMEEPEATPPPTPMPESIADIYFVPAVIGIIVAIVVVGAILAILLLRKRP
ncbi:PQQ-binding-like beta-propeller repeat protein [Candidatus Bathyarchaeota archaeon A05DMB-2]|nr:PQQ-binding-like beta-propeller repeat protein [Candidatus Bathyarchaeota archaeon A05DMB-2]